MKTILIATDFSKASRNAALYGMQLAKFLNAKVYLFNAYQISSTALGLNVSVSRYDVMMQTDKLLLDEANFLDPTSDIIEFLCDEGLPEKTIIDIANEKKVDFIITGMKGSGKNFKKIFGSTATLLAKSTNIPLIIVPENTVFKKPEVIVFANDGSIDSDKNALEYLAAITRTFTSKLYLVKVIKEKDEEWFEVSDIAHKLNKIIKILDSKFQYPVGTNVQHALNKFIITCHADMLVMVPHKHNWLEHLFRKSETKSMLFQTHIPLLVLPETNLQSQVIQQETIQTEKAIY
jgi:nucleotide-binding universal stress UspA family protein